jgi:hypothetical protein
MIIKSLSRKNPKYRQLARYIAGKGRKKSAFIVRHNLLTDSDDADDLAREIEENSLYARDRKNGVKMFHEILSFSPKDKAVITAEMLEDVAREYLAERLGNCGLGFAGVHWEKENVHIHVMIGANQIKSRRKLRISRGDFDRLKRRMSGIVKGKYPELVHTYDQNKRDKSKVRERQRENRRNHRLKEQGRNAPSKKELARLAVIGAVNAAKTAAGFMSILKDGGFTPYKRGKTLGLLKDGLRFRLSTLGVLEMAMGFFETLKRTGKHLVELKEIQSRNEHEREPMKEQEQGREMES